MFMYSITTVEHGGIPTKFHVDSSCNIMMSALVAACVTRSSWYRMYLKQENLYCLHAVTVVIS